MLKKTLILLFALSFSSLVHSDVRFASWNIKHFGWNNDKDTKVVSSIASGFDLIAIQELMKPQALMDLEKELEDLTGEQWTQMSSNSIGRSSSYREHYGFIWRNSEVSYLDGAVVYIDSKDAFIREPYSARFLDRDTDKSFAVATTHILFGDSISDRAPEIRALGPYWEWLKEVYSYDTDRLILAGDFNLDPSHDAWSELKQYADPMITKGKTTLSKTDGEYSSLYDNIWVPKQHDFDIQIYGIFKFTAYMDTITGRFWSNEEARSTVSDHAPVYLLLGTKDINMKTLDHSQYPASQALRKTSGNEETDDSQKMSSGSSCVDLNASPSSDLQKIPYVGSQRVSLIVSGRPWDSIESLTRIRGIGAATLTKIMDSGIVCEI